MFSIPHLIIVFVVALVVFGPEKLPELARNLGKLMGEFRRATGDLRSTFEGHLRDLEREANQRRIGGSTVAPTPEASASTTSSSPAMEQEISTALAAAGTVPTTPPHLGIGTAAAQPTGTDGAPCEAETVKTADTAKTSPSAEADPHPESVTDAGIPRA